MQVSPRSHLHGTFALIAPGQGKKQVAPMHPLQPFSRRGRTRRIGTEMFVFNQESALCLRLATNLSNHKVHSVLVISYPGSKKDQQTRGHQVDQPCHLNIGRCFLDRMPHIAFYTQHALYTSITEELGEPLGQSCAHRQTLLQRELKLASLSSRRLSGYSIVRATSTIGSASG